MHYSDWRVGLIPGRGKRSFSSKYLHWLWAPPSLLFSGYWVYLPWDKVDSVGG